MRRWLRCWFFVRFLPNLSFSEIEKFLIRLAALALLLLGIYKLIYQEFVHAAPIPRQFREQQYIPPKPSPDKSQFVWL